MIRHGSRIRTAAAAALTLATCAQARDVAAQTVWEDLQLQQVLVSNTDRAELQVYFDKQVCENGQNRATISKASPSYAFLVSIAMAALASNRKARVETLLADGDVCVLQSFTLLK